jgi:hypothetical protein
MIKLKNSIKLNIDIFIDIYMNLFFYIDYLRPVSVSYLMTSHFAHFGCFLFIYVSLFRMLMKNTR